MKACWLWEFKSHSLWVQGFGFEELIKVYSEAQGDFVSILQVYLKPTNHRITE